MPSRLDFYRQTYVALYEPIMEMSRTGIRVDRVRMEQRYTEICEELALLRAKLLKMAGHELFGKAGSLSTDRAATFFYETLGCSPIYKRKKKGEKPSLTVDEIAVRRIRTRNQSRPRVVRACDYILRFRFLDARKKFYKPSVVDRDGRFRASYNFTPPTLRFGSSKNPMGTGHNGQNLPRDSRDHWLPDKGHVFMPLDLSQAESRVVYMLTGEPDLVKLACLPPWEYDDHQAVADLIDDILVQEGIVGDSADDPKVIAKKKRYFGKQTNHGCLTPDHEVLTINGWTNIVEVKPDEPIKIYDPIGRQEFFCVPERKVEYDYDDLLVWFHSKGIDQAVTLNHKMLVKPTVGFTHAEEARFVNPEQHAIILSPSEAIIGYKADRISYRGKVYCFTVPTGYFLVRRNGKISVTGNSNYGETGIAMSKFILKQGYVVAPDTCQKMINAKMKARPAILDVFQRGIRRRIMDDKRLVNPFGHELNFAYARPEAKTFRQGYMFIPQSIPPTVVNQFGWVPFMAARKRWRWDARVANQAHDELLFSVHPDDAWDLLCFMQQSLERPIWYRDLEQETARPMTIPVSVKIGSNGGNLFEFDKPPTRKRFMEVVRAAAAGERFN